VYSGEYTFPVLFVATVSAAVLPVGPHLFDNLYVLSFYMIAIIPD
jgi:hypothetical protein